MQTLLRVSSGDLQFLVPISLLMLIWYCFASPYLASPFVALPPLRTDPPKLGSFAGKLGKSSGGRRPHCWYGDPVVTGRAASAPRPRRSDGLLPSARIRQRLAALGDSRGRSGCAQVFFFAHNLLGRIYRQTPIDYTSVSERVFICFP